MIPPLLSTLPAERLSACALAIGNFDGVHVGHQTLMRMVVRYAAEHALIPAALTFDPHPAAIVAPERLPEMICTVPQRVQLLREAGAETVIVLPFTEELSRKSPREFIEQYLLGHLNAQAIFVGENFRFGHKQSGDVRILATLGRELDFYTSFLPPVFMRGEVVSSSSIRKHIRSGHVSVANRLLGRCFSFNGPVAAGHGVGSKQTVPTLNLHPIPGLVSPRGVFISETIDRQRSRRWASITNIGNRPTFGGEAVTIETFLLDPFDGDRPSEIEVGFHRFIRPEQKFDTPEALKLQIFRDAGRAQSFWRRARRWVREAPSAAIA